MRTHTHQKGAAVLIVVVFFVVLSTTLLIGISTPIVQQINNATEYLSSKKSYIAADSQLENALYRLNKGKTDAPSVLSMEKSRYPLKVFSVIFKDSCRQDLSRIRAFLSNTVCRAESAEYR
jgi:predicted PurR-regulated permease PerM